MHPVDFYDLVSRDRRRAARHLLCYDARGLRRFAGACALHLRERFGVPVSGEHVLAVWWRVALVSEPHAAAALCHCEHAVGE